MPSSPEPLPEATLEVMVHQPIVDVPAMLAEGRRVLAIDLGTKRIGLAVSDPLGTFAVGLETLNRAKGIDVMAAIGDVCRQKNVGLMVLGLPINMDGTEGLKAEESRAFGAKLQASLHLPVVWLDERLTSRMAEQQLKAQQVSFSRNKGLVDEQAAMILLSDFLARYAKPCS